MSGSGTRFLATALLSLNLLPTSLGAQTVSINESSARTVSASRFSRSLAAQEQEPQDPAPQQPAPEHGDVKPDPELEMALRRKHINETLLSLAQDDFRRMSKLSETGYSKDLRDRESKLTKYLARHNPDRPQAVYVDPNHFDTGLALGFTPEDATEKILGLKRVKVDANQLKEIASDMKTDDGSKFASSGAFTQNPSAHYDEFKMGPQACVIVPTSGYSPEFEVGGMNYKENLDFVNKHEGWHCMNTKFTFAGIPKEQVDAIDVDRLERSIGNPQQMEAISRQNKNESLSDVGAVGDMIRAGGDIDLIDKLQAARAAHSDDYLHWSVSPLEALKQKINEMGIDKFRRLNGEESRALYEDLVDKSALSPTTAEIMLTYRTGTDDDRAAIRDWKSSFGTMEALMTAGAAVHDGADMKTLDDAIGKAADPKVKAALSGLRDQINEMGVDRFRGLNEDEAARIAGALKDKGLTLSDTGDNAAAYWRMSADERKQAMDEVRKYENAMPQAVAIMKPYPEPPTDAEKAAQNNTPSPPLTDAEKKVFDQLKNWDAAKLLQDRAFSKEHKITPETLVHAYGKMQDELRDELKKHPQDPLLRAKVTKLQQSYINTVQTLDYVAVNADRGVNIFEKEPKLAEALRRERDEEERKKVPGTLVGSEPEHTGGEQPPLPEKVAQPRRQPAPGVS